MSSDSLSTTSSRSSRSSFHIDMPSKPYPDTAATPTPTPTSAITTPSPNPQNPISTSWHAHPAHLPHIHIATPHPLAAATQYLDKHVVPVFAKHHQEYVVNRDIRAAKREARQHSLVDSPIPELDDDDDDGDNNRHNVVNANSSTAAAAGLADLGQGQGQGHAHAHAEAATLDNDAWQAILAKREAARLRSGSDISSGESAFSHGPK
ncbi:hypothetical protein PV05_01358 [Exophiala xenobiotica]|uniref:Uncharacterized protein n=1 Tax=Exophiala xenobiotica TaxID=348802 RepID=A0A0D2FM29_9EURO|nr:uncharacterized protein PV05_01358 [Exophiala xenobiotica]KIW61204.1 hypothetical protein PV05_01358 [Exophiala xenobiotica]